MGKRSWLIILDDTGSEVSALIINQTTFNMLPIGPIPYDGPEGWDEACADLFAGPLPCIRDSFDQV